MFAKNPWRQRKEYGWSLENILWILMLENIRITLIAWLLRNIKNYFSAVYETVYFFYRVWELKVPVKVAEQKSEYV